MEKADKYIKYCRYYKGKDKCPEDLIQCPNGGYLWNIEKEWVTGMLAHGDAYFSEGVSEYNHYVNPKVDEKFGIPVSLLGYIFYRISKWQFSLADWGKEFASYIENEYVFKPSKNKISYNNKSFLEYIDKCRYYQGRYFIPFEYKGLGKDLIWDYERIWVQKHFLLDGEDVKSNEKFFKDLIRHYKKHGLGHFNDKDGVPISFKALLFNRYEHWTQGTAEGFKVWYREQYLKMPKEWCLEFCQFYRGEDECPEVLVKHNCYGVWRAEKYWVNDMMNEGCISDYFSFYYNHDGLNKFNQGDGIHRTLKEFLYGRMMADCEGMLKPEEFKEWYNKKYIPLGKSYRNGELK
jgi:hypothetical protein